MLWRPWLRRLVLGLGLIPAAGAVARGAGVPILYHKTHVFRINLDIAAEDRPRLTEVRLYVSIDQGYHWKNWAQTGPDKPSIAFRAPKDGEYWFAVCTVDTKGRLYPSEDTTVEPSMKVIVDTTPPTIDLAPMSRKGSKASVRWEVHDEHLDPKSLVLEYQVPGRGDWKPVPIQRRLPLDYAEWDAGTAEAVRVRAAVYDRAKNRQTASIELPEGIGAAPGTASVDPRDFASPPPITPITPASIASEADPFPASPSSSPSPEPPPIAAGDEAEARPAPAPPVGGGRPILTASPNFSLKYAVDDAGPSGPARVQLWMTRNNGKSWTVLPEDPDRVSPYEVRLGGDGTYGLSLCVEGANGQGDPPPAPGDPPQMWVVVDRTPPVIQLGPAQVGAGSRAGTVSLSWRSSDDHPGTRSVVISCRPDRPGAPWKPISGRIEDSGRFDWTVPASFPDRFFLKVEIDDALGNRGSAETPAAVLLDRARPKSRILGLDPAPKAKY